MSVSTVPGASSCASRAPSVYPTGGSVTIIRTAKMARTRKWKMGQSARHTLALNRGLFKCSSAKNASGCVPPSFICDGNRDCDDGSDETKYNCSMLFYIVYFIFK
ncbi:hypothetical protein DPMN_184521 [Dreissena polymorpha]|uniref:Uncharacterized protein n=1 Tax=Dreissena polymorpha TaxID=45954 RepID=A0A9D4DKJ6_DREPO|nr:hypothetical protein DPMN_184521 [Dreissena polymorpha]